MGLGLFLVAIFNLLTPLAAKGGFGVFVVLRVLMGLAEGMSGPSIHQFWFKWAPPFERSRLVTITVAGMHVGTVVSLSTCGVLVQNYGWESVFYIYGGIGCVWYVIWLIFIYDSPDKDPFISEEEKLYISSKTKDQPIRPAGNVPWLKILTSTAVWAVIAAHFSENWGNYTLLTQLPTFLKCALLI